MKELTKIVVFALAMLASACSTQRAEVAAWDEVAEQLVPQHQVAETAAAMSDASGAQSGATWFNLCDRKDCAGPALQYTQTFREAALLASAVRQAEKLGVPVAADAEELSELRDRVTMVKLELQWMSPLDDLDEVAKAERGLKLAKEQIKFAAEHLARVEQPGARVAYAR